MQVECKLYANKSLEKHITNMQFICYSCANDVQKWKQGDYNICKSYVIQMLKIELNCLTNSTSFAYELHIICIKCHLLKYAIETQILARDVYISFAYHWHIISILLAYTKLRISYAVADYFEN